MDEQPATHATPRGPSFDRPAFRQLEVHPVEHRGQAGIVLHDPLGIAPEQVFVPEGLLPVVSLFDGQRTVPAIQAEVAHLSDQPVPADFVEDLVRGLDERLVLFSPRFEAALQAATDDFLARSARPARHAGSAGYPATAPAAREALDSMVGRPKAPPRQGSRQPGPRGLIAPHIDLVRGREGYVMAYGYLAECEPADLYVVFGTGHQGPSAPVTGLMMDWLTPLGTARTDRDFIQRIHDALGPADPIDQFLHRDEHSLEFQMLFLSHVLQPYLEQGHEFQVAGFLTGMLPWAGDGTTVMQESYVQKLLDAFRKHTEGRRVCFVGGADLAHVGPFFGDQDSVDQERLDLLTRVEREKLGHLQGGDPGAFHRSVEHNGNPDRICGTTPMVLTAALAGGEGQLLHYEQARAPDGSQCVSFCSMVFQ